MNFQSARMALLLAAALASASAHTTTLQLQHEQCLVTDYDSPVPKICRVCGASKKLHSLPTERQMGDRFEEVDLEAEGLMQSSLGYREAAAQLEREPQADWIRRHFDEVIVISLPERRQRMKEALRSWGIKKATFFDAFNKSTLDFEKLKTDGFLPAYAKVKEEHKVQNYKYTPGRVACHYSHTSVLKHLVDKGIQTAFIMEDDLQSTGVKKLADSESRFETAMQQLPEDWKVVNFGRCWDKCSQDKVVAPTIVASTRPLCRNAYGVTNAGALDLLNATVPMVTIGDHSFSKHVSYCVSPRIFSQDRANYTSFIGNHDGLHECRDGHPQPLPLQKSFIGEDAAAK